MGPDKAWGPNKILGPGIDLRTPRKIFSPKPCPQPNQLLHLWLGILYDDYFCLVALNKQQIFIRKSTNVKRDAKSGPPKVWPHKSLCGQ